MESPIALQSFKDFLPIVQSILVDLEVVQSEKYSFLVQQAKETAVNLLTNLAVGYNKYHAIEKMSAYSTARSEASKLQTQLHLLKHLDIIQNLYDFGTCFASLNGLIRSMEAKS